MTRQPQSPGLLTLKFVLALWPATPQAGHCANLTSSEDLSLSQVPSNMVGLSFFDPPAIWTTLSNRTFLGPQSLTSSLSQGKIAFECQPGLSHVL